MVLFSGEDESDKEEDEEELDKKMGDLGEGQTDTLDERMWGDSEDDDAEEGSDREEESGQGMDQVPSQHHCRMLRENVSNMKNGSFRVCVTSSVDCE